MAIKPWYKLVTPREDLRDGRPLDASEFAVHLDQVGYLNYLRNPQIQQDVHRSQNRIEAYHQLRSSIAQVGGKKQLIGSTDLDVAISNQCGRLVANVVIAYNSIILSALLERYL